MFKERLSKGIVCLIILGLIANKGFADVKGTKTITETKEASKMAEEYQPKVIIDLKWHKVKEELVPHESALSPSGGIISCGRGLYGRFGKGTVSFGFYDYSIVPSLTMPRSITLDQEGNLYILDPANFKVLKFDKNGGYLDTIKLERVKPKKGKLGEFEITEGWWIGENEKIYIGQDGYIYLTGVRNAWGNLNTFKFTKTGRFIGTETSFFEKKKYGFTSKVQDSKKGIVQVIDQKKNIKLLEIPVNLSPKLASQNYELEDIEVIEEDKGKNLYVKISVSKLEEEEKIKLYKKEQVYKYTPQGKLLFIFPEKENHPRQQEITPTTVVTDQGTIYDMVVIWEEEQEIKSFTYKLSFFDKIVRDLEDYDRAVIWEEGQKEKFSSYKLSPSDKMIGNLEDIIEEFLKEREKSGKKDKKILLKFGEGGFKLPKELKVIKWEKVK
ncbi:MAG: hypothetical protein AB1630_11000 [bacterium]